MARYSARRSTRRTYARRAVARSGGYARRRAGNSPRRRASTGRAQVVRIVVSGSSPAAAPVTLSSLGKLMVPGGQARSQF